MELKKLEVGYQDIDHECGHMRIIVNGTLKPTIPIDFDNGNNSWFVLGLRQLIESVYSEGYSDAERDGKRKVMELIEWAASRQETGD